MASSYDKVVKLACKPKAAPPKTKYLDPIIAATWSEDGAVHDVCRALSPRLREPNAIVVFKALIVLHTMIRNGATDNVLGYLSSSDILRLRNISAGHWEGYNAPQNLQAYATYLDARIRAYRDLKHDAIRVQSETNRDLRNSQAIEEDRAEQHIERSTKSTRRRFGSSKKETVEEHTPPSSLHQRSKTLAGRKLRIMTVEKGLLRETKIVQKMIDSLVECRFYLDDLEDELNITALRMLVKDLLILFQACNEGVINVLEHYFEMSRIDAKEALAIYRHFCKETERVVEYLGVAKKLQNLLNVPIPNLRHAPVSLAGSLEEYLNDPNFEQNRIEYKTNKEAADRNGKMGIKPGAKAAEKPPSPKPSSSTAPAAAASSSSSSGPPKTPDSQAMIDFFSAIEGEQQTMFNPQTNSPTANYFQQQAAYNPFAQRQMMTGAPFGQPQAQQPVQMQATGFFQPQQSQHTNPFGLQALQQPQPFGNFLQAQPTGFIQPHATGVANPFRQSTLFPQTTGMPSFGMNMNASGMQPPQQPQQQQQQQPQAPMGAASPNPFPGQPSSNNPFPMQSQPLNGNPFPGQMQSTNPFPGPGQLQPQTTNANPFPSQTQTSSFPGAPQSTNPFPSSTSTNQFNSSQPSGPSLATPFFTNASSSFASPTAHPVPSNSSISAVPSRPMSAPLRSNTTGVQPVKTHQTGSRNPFGVPVEPAPPVPKVPTLMELSVGMAYGNNTSPNSNAQQQQQSQSTGIASNPTGFNPSGSNFGFGTTSSTGIGAGSSTAAGGSTMSNVASAFSFGNDHNKAPTRSSTMPFSGLPTGSTITSTSPSATGSTFSSSLFSSFSPQAASTNATSNPPSISVSPPSIQPLQPQATGFAGIKPFKPSSSFGAALLDSLPSIPQSAPTTPGPGNTSSLPGNSASISVNGNATNPTTTTATSPTSGLSSFGGGSSGLSPFGSSTVGVGLRPQATGTVAAANPFRASMFAGSSSPIGAFGTGSGGLPNSNTFPALGTNPTGFAGLGSSQFGGGGNGAGGFGAGLGGSMFGSGLGGQTQQQQHQQQQNGNASLI